MPEADDKIREREDADALNEIVLAVDMRERGTLGCAYYVAREEKLFIMADIKLAGLDVVDTLKLHALPTVVLISTKSDEMLEDHLMKEAKEIDSSDNPGMAKQVRVSYFADLFLEAMFGSYILDSRPSAEFQYEAATGKLVNLDPSFDDDQDHKMQFCVPGDELVGNSDHIQDYEDQETRGHQGRLLKLAGSIDLESRMSVSSLASQTHCIS